MATLWERAASRLTICSLCILTICKFSYSRFAFEGGIRVMVSPVLGHCMLVTLTIYIFIILYMYNWVVCDYKLHVRVNKSTFMLK